MCQFSSITSKLDATTGISLNVSILLFDILKTEDKNMDFKVYFAKMSTTFKIIHGNNICLDIKDDSKQYR